MNKVIKLEQAIAKIKDGAVIMVGGFLAVGTPLKLIEALAQSGRKDLTLICNDTAYEDRGVGKLIVNKQFKKCIVSHIGTNKETGRQLIAGETEIVLTPQGTLAEQVRAGGAGIGGILTKTGVGTMVAEGKERLTIDGVDYLLEKALRADVALIYGSKVDKFGNIYYEGATQNFNVLMATAADLVIVEADELVEVGELDPNIIRTSGVFVDYIVAEDN